MHWDETYSVKVRELDDQHKQLFQLVNELHDAMKSGQGRTFLAQVLNRLIRYTREHFSYEEERLAKADYKEYLPHVAEHRKLTEQVETFSRDLKAGTAVMSMEVMEFLQQWLTSHILKVDQKYSKDLRAKA